MIPEDWLWRNGDQWRDFCQWDYSPQSVPVQGTLRQAALLWQSLAPLPHGDALKRMFHAIRDCVGPFGTVWGIKSGPAGLTWELYFYDYDREARRIGLSALSDSLGGMFARGLTAADRWPWFMASIEFDASTAASGRIDQVDLYFEAEGGTISAGVSEVWDGRTRRAKNDYRFYRSAEDRDLLLQDLAELPPLPGPFMPGRYGEEVFVISRKAASSAAYASRVGIDGTIAFSVETGFDPSLARFLRHHRDRLLPYLFDLGIDYSEGRILRSAIYGIF